MGFFICIEGLDKSGKTTHSRLLVKNLNQIGYCAVYTREPSDGSIGQLIRRVILQRKERVPPVLEAILFAADRLDHIENEIKPLLKQGKIIVADRYLYSSLAYQGAAGLDVAWILKINRFILKPDLAIYIDVPIEILERRLRRERSVMEKIEVQLKVKKIYDRLVEKGYLIPVNGNRRIEEVSQDILTIVRERLNF